MKRTPPFSTSSHAFTASAAGRLVNMSIRTSAGTGDNTLIVGLGIGGAGTNGTKAALFRGVGPTLGAFGVVGVLSDPKLEIFSGPTKTAENDNWTTSDAATFASVGAFALNTGSRDAALVTTLQPGSYTVQVSGVGNTTGVALVEVYELP